MIKKTRNHLINKNIHNILQRLRDPSRFYGALSNKMLYLYDNLSQNIYSFGEHYLPVFTTQNKFDCYKALDSIDSTTKKALSIDIKEILKWNENKVVKNRNDSECNVQVCMSTICNLNCTYCFRDKTLFIERPDYSLLEDVIQFAKSRYKPKARGYSFSYNITSEILCDTKILDELLRLLPQYESYLVTENELLPNSVEILKGISEATTIRGRKPNIGEVKDYLNKIISSPDIFKSTDVDRDIFKECMNEYIFEYHELGDWLKRKINRRYLEIVHKKYLPRKEPAYCASWFMSNATMLNSKTMHYLKAFNMKEFNISIDGPKDVHDYFRKDPAGNGTYDTVVDSIKLLHENKIRIISSTVLTAHFPQPLAIAQHLITLGIDEGKCVMTRGDGDYSFTEKNLGALIENYRMLYRQIFTDLCNNNNSLIRFLRNDVCLAPLMTILTRKRRSRRCSWGDQLVIDHKGDAFPCSYFLGNDEFSLGSINDPQNKSPAAGFPKIELSGQCEKCWAKHLCGGTCHYNSWISTGRHDGIDAIECRLMKFFAKECIELIAQMTDAGINVQKII